MENPPVKKMQKRTRFTIIYLIVITGVVIAQYYFLKPKVHEISYSQFRSFLNYQQIEKVELTPEKIRGMLKKGVMPPDSITTGIQGKVDAMRGSDERTFVVNPL